MSFPHKCGQFVWCRVFNVVVAATFSPDIFSFVIGYLPWCLSSEEWLPFVQNSQDNWAPSFHTTFQGGSTSWELSPVLYYLPLSLTYWPQSLSNLSTILGLLYVLGHGLWPNTLAQPIYPHSSYNDPAPTMKILFALG